MVARDGRRGSAPSPESALRFEMVEVARVVAELLNERGDLLGEPVVLLQIDDEVRLRRAADLAQGVDVARVSIAMRITSAPAASRSSTWRVVAAMSWVRVAVIDCTAIRFDPPIATLPILISRVCLFK